LSWWVGEEDVERLTSVPSLPWHLLDVTGYMHEQATRPDTLATALAASPIAWAAWQVEKMAQWSDLRAADGSVVARHGLDWLLANVHMYWRRGVVGIASSLRLYAESLNSPGLAASAASRVDTLTYVSDFPREVMRVPRVVASQRYANLGAFTSHSDTGGGHFAALEEPATLARDVADTVGVQWALREV